VKDDDRGNATLAITLGSVVLLLAGIGLTRIHAVAVIGVVLFVFGCLGLIEAIAFALGIIDLDDGRRRDGR
jgi:cell division protein FtsW (lipid II flippase)